jgi:hypothetical protein
MQQLGQARIAEAVLVHTHTLLRAHAYMSFFKIGRGYAGLEVESRV